MTKPFLQLTNRGKVARLRRAALEALSHYPFRPAKLSFVANDCHCIFLVRTDTGERYAVRICAAVTDQRTATSEMQWLESLQGGEGLNTPVPLRTCRGKLCVTIDSPLLDAPRRCVVYTWMPGPILGSRMTPGNMRKFGQLAADLHLKAKSFAPPRNFYARVWANLSDYVEKHEAVPDLFQSQGLGHALTKPRRGQFRSTVESLTQALRVLHTSRGERQLVHGDLHTWNASVSRRTVHLFDFHSFCWGLPVQDAALAIAFLRQQYLYRTLDPALLDAFRSGYCSIRPWPEEWEALILDLVRGHFVGHMCNVLQLDFVSSSDKERCVARTFELLKPKRKPDIGTL